MALTHPLLLLISEMIVIGKRFHLIDEAVLQIPGQFLLDLIVVRLLVCSPIIGSILIALALIVDRRHLVMVLRVVWTVGVLLFLDDLGNQCQILKEIFLCSVLAENLENAHDTVVSLIHKIVECRCISERDHTVHRILAQNNVLVMDYLLQLTV
jgi:hypothetical protein